jgi:hypothetical protein
MLGRYLSARNIAKNSIKELRSMPLISRNIVNQLQDSVTKERDKRVKIIKIGAALLYAIVN